jgi:hypothetical protein
MLYICMQKYNTMEAEHRTPKKKQTAFRLSEDLLDRLKAKAKEDNRSLNNYVENVLRDVAYDPPMRTEPQKRTTRRVSGYGRPTESPSGKEPRYNSFEEYLHKEISPDIRALAGIVHITEEDINNDDRLAYLLGK